MYKIACEYEPSARYVKNYDSVVEYPEYPWKHTDRQTDNNDIYNMIRNCLIDLELDKEHIGTSEWNPLNQYIQPENTVVIKPNLVMHKNYRKGHEHDVECLYTNPCVVAPVIDYVVIALKGKGKIIIGDAPVQECDFDTLMTSSGYKELIHDYQKRGVDIEIQDFRGIKSVSDYGVLKQSLIPNVDSTTVRMNEQSAFSGVEDKLLKRMRITNYAPDELYTHHNAELHEYCIAKSVLQADCIINMPKPKTHKKAGITACLKNLVGINCRKEYLPHHTMGSVHDGGDEYNNKSGFKAILAKTHDRFCDSVAQRKYLSARFFQTEQVLIEFIIKKLMPDRTTFGSWKGNHTISKTIVDLNRILVYADKNGTIQNKPQRKVFNIADMIISGQHNGPMSPEPRPVGIILAGENSVAVDLVVARLMRAKTEAIPTLQFYKNDRTLPIYNDGNEIIVYSHDRRWNEVKLDDFNETNSFCFKAPDDWEDCFDG